MVGDLKSTKPRSAAKRDAITEAAMRHFAEHGYQGARVEDLARELGIAKGSIFQHFGSKAGLFLAAYRRAVETLPAWLERTEHLVQERADLDVEMAASMLDWMAGGFQDAPVSKDLDPGLLHRHPNPEQQRALRIEQFVDLLRRSFGAAP